MLSAINRNTCPQSPESACCAVEAIFRAGTILDELSPAVLEQVRDYCTDWNKGRKGSFSEFKHAWIDLVADHLNEQRMTERRLYHGIMGPSADATLEKQALKKA